MNSRTTRRDFLKISTVSALALAQNAAAQEKSSSIVVDPKPLFDISPYLYMQFMEPLGATDNSMEAAWSYDRDDWRTDFIDITKDLAPGDDALRRPAEPVL